MRLELTGRHVVITPALRATVERRLRRLARKLNDSVLSVQIVLTKESTRYRTEATLHVKGDHFLHGEGADHQARASLDAALARLEHQADTLKGKWVSRQRKPAVTGAVDGRAGSAVSRRGRGAREHDTDRVVRIVRARRYEVKPMTVDDAAIQIGPTESAFVVFRNSSTDSINVLFRRADGHLGLIEPED
jgi:putative sigma-54 modulation protein